jgi:RNA polymerase sigma factor (sigma-70 family)
MESRNAAGLFEDNLDLIDLIIALIKRRTGLSDEEAEEFGCWAKLRLLENDCAILSRFEHRSSLTTYLSVVLHHLARDYRRTHRARWRPSARARALGALAVALETMISRDGFSLAEAVRMLRSNFRVEESDLDLEQLASQLPRRPFVVPELATHITPAASDEALRANVELRPMARRLQHHLVKALRELSDEERRILELRFSDGLKVVEIAAQLGLDPQATYYRAYRALRTLRRRLEEAGIHAANVAEVMGWSDLELDLEAGFRDDAAQNG